MGRDQHDPERFGREHHRHVDVPSKVRQPLGMSWIGKPGKVERVLVGRGGDDGVHLTAQGELDRGLDRVPREPAGAYCARPIFLTFTGPHAPGPDRQPMTDGYRAELIVRADQREVRIQRLGQRAGDDLWTDASRVAQGDRESRSRATNS
jgi:hypothetical protein